MARHKKRRRNSSWIRDHELAITAVMTGTVAFSIVASILRMRAKRAIAICNAVGPAIGNLVPGRESTSQAGVSP